MESPYDFQRARSARPDYRPISTRDMVDRLLASERYTDAEKALLSKLADMLGIDESGIRGIAPRNELDNVMAEIHSGGLGPAARLLMSIRYSDAA